MSLPPPPIQVSKPGPPRGVSLPGRPRKRSLPTPPRARSFSEESLRRGCPRRSLSTAARGKAQTGSLHLPPTLRRTTSPSPKISRTLQLAAWRDSSNERPATSDAGANRAVIGRCSSLSIARSSLPPVSLFSRQIKTPPLALSMKLSTPKPRSATLPAATAAAMATTPSTMFHPTVRYSRKRPRASRSARGVSLNGGSPLRSAVGRWSPAGRCCVRCRNLPISTRTARPEHEPDPLRNRSRRALRQHSSRW